MSLVMPHQHFIVLGYDITVLELTTHIALKGQMGSKLTVEEMGGLECGKCHY